MNKADFKDYLEENKDKLKDFDSENIISDFNKVYESLEKIGSKSITYNITRDESIFFQIKLNENHIFLELFIDEENELIVSDGYGMSFGGDVEKVLTKLIKFYG